MSKQAERVFGTGDPVALVTGSGKLGRIGNHIARLLAGRGYHVVLHAHRSESDAASTIEDLQAVGRSATFFSADFRQPDQPRQLVERAYDWRQRLDVLVNAAAIWRPRPLEEVTPEDLEQHWRINTQATFITCQAAGERMIPQAMGGAIINLGDWAIQRPYVNYSAYFASKAGISVMTRDMAVELGTRNPRIRVNAVLPGTVTLPPDAASEIREAAINETLVRREGTPQHVADAVLALIENDYITGATLPVDGGRSVYVGSEAGWRRGGNASQPDS